MNGQGRPLIAAAVIVALFLPGPVWAIGRRQDHRVWFGLGTGFSRLYRASDDEVSSHTNCFSLFFRGGYDPTTSIRLGLEMGGWLIEAGNLNDPSKGEAVAQYRALGQVYPVTSTPIFLRAAFGRASYWNNHPDSYHSAGWGSTFGLGYDWHMSKRWSVSPVFTYSRGGLGDVREATVGIENRRYETEEVLVEFTYR